MISITRWKSYKKLKESIKQGNKYVVIGFFIGLGLQLSDLYIHFISKIWQ